jgi:signal transduction histidine kinase
VAAQDDPDLMSTSDGPAPSSPTSARSVPIGPDVGRSIRRLVGLTALVVAAGVGLRVADGDRAGAAAFSLVTLLVLAGVAGPLLRRRRSTFDQVVFWGGAGVVVVIAAVDSGWSTPGAVAIVPIAVVAVLLGRPADGAQVAAFGALAIGALHLSISGSSPDRTDLAVAVAWCLALAAVVIVARAWRDALDRAATHDASSSPRRADRVAEANTLLTALRQVTRDLPSSLDLDDVVDTTLTRIGSLVPNDTLALYLRRDDGSFELLRSRGHRTPSAISHHVTFGSVRSALEERRTVRSGALEPGAGLAPTSRSALVTALRSGTTVVGLLVIESDQPDGQSVAHAEIVHGIAQPFGTAIENSRMFRQLRSTTVSEERRRIARDLHDQVGSSLALVGFEVDRARQMAERGEPVVQLLDELRLHVTAVIGEIRETLHDLRTDVDDASDLPTVLRRHLDRVAERRGLATAVTGTSETRPPRQVERELWQIALEAITNVERHARATRLEVTYTAIDGLVRLEVLDDGIGLNTDASGTDRYGMVGMRERTESIGATLRVTSAPDRGTRIVVELHTDGRTAGGVA